MTTLRLRDASPETAKAHKKSAFIDSFPDPFITISRDPGSGGKLVGQEVARELGFAFYDQELIEEIAKSTKMRKSVLNKIDEKARTALQDLIQGLMNPNYVSDVTYFSQLCRVILSLAYKGKVVILGRGANFITPAAKGLHVRITAPLQVCVQRAIDYEGHPPDVAKEIVKKYETDRREFVRQYFDKDIRKSDYYDLIINTTFYTPKEAAAVVIKAFKKKFSLE
ncbi:hypothetical protein A2356_00160 [Candidatus Nomurabacteria bacterium RIFOXYB1_FULL_39_16]|uniref:Cytidylate kinase n=1 Tax=Candidatus Nomurabacteria bacterium RIFOXYB1_FULL_39_16 TaxID=1801803 RepID=A0A1F6YR81_9BACT|nr:MAG: hypothetical protein A2356_00160 [Candidatus Nomurabacteria bacterium RIFOXYB1_FULL_39_16]